MRLNLAFLLSRLAVRPSGLSLSGRELPLFAQFA